MGGARVDVAIRARMLPAGQASSLASERTFSVDALVTKKRNRQSVDRYSWFSRMRARKTPSGEKHCHGAVKYDLLQFTLGVFTHFG